VTVATDKGNAKGDTRGEWMRILLVGQPNVGKSAVFSRLTGAHVIASNYPGTTVAVSQGRLRVDGSDCAVIDVPGTYTLDATCRAEEVAVEMLDHGDIIVNVVDSTNLERNLNLTLQLLKRRRPTLVVLNIWDEAVEHGVHIDVPVLERELDVPVVPTCAISGEGMRELVDRLKEARPSGLEFDDTERWHVVGNIVERVQRFEHRHPTLGQALSHASVHPVIGPIFALVVLFLSFELVRRVGEGIIGHVTEPAFDRLWLPVVARLSGWLGAGQSGGWLTDFLHALLIGQLMDGRIEFGESFGLLTTGVFIPLAAVLPYVFAFYLVLSILEDTGYLPRLGVLMDTVMHRVGLHGLSVVPMLLGLGCNVPGALSLRVLETRKERFIAATLMAICIPCMAQIAMVAALLGEYGAAGFGLVLVTLGFVWLVLGLVLKRSTRGTTPEILVDIPPYRLPYWPSLAKKLWMRLKGFLREAVPYVLLGVMVVNVMYALGVIGFLERVVTPVTRRVLDLPAGAVGALVVGLLRKDVAVGMLRPLNLSFRQTVVACVILMTYFPCMATFVVLMRELGVKDMLKAAGIMLFVSFGTGAALNLVLKAVYV